MGAFRSSDVGGANPGRSRSASTGRSVPPERHGWTLAWCGRGHAHGRMIHWGEPRCSPNVDVTGPCTGLHVPLRTPGLKFWSRRPTIHSWSDRRRSNPLRRATALCSGLTPPQDVPRLGSILVPQDNVHLQHRFHPPLGRQRRQWPLVLRPGQRAGHRRHRDQPLPGTARPVQERHHVAVQRDQRWRHDGGQDGARRRAKGAAGAVLAVVEAAERLGLDAPAGLPGHHRRREWR